MRVKWYGTPKLDRILARNVARTGQLYMDDLVELISIQGPPRSEPLTPPHIDTMELINSIDVTADMSPDFPVAQIYSDAEHSVYLELGTDRMAPRPAWLPLLHQNGDDYARSICRV